MDFLVPKLSATMETVKVLRWFKEIGDKVAIGEPLVELETDKAAMEVESPAEGTLEAVLAGEGQELAIGAVLARLRTAAEIASASETASTATKVAARSAPEEEFVVASPRSPPGAHGSRVLASPFARHLAKMNGTDLRTLAAANPLRRIRGRDVSAALESRGAKVTLTAPARAEFEPFPPMRRQIAESVILSRRTIPSFVIDRWVETTAIDQARASRGDELGRSIIVKPTLTDFLLAGLADSFLVHPRILDRWHEVNGHAGRMRALSVDVGLVVAVSDGVMIPVLRDLAGKSVHEIAQMRRDAVQRARSSRLLEADFAPVSFSVSNLGASGADRFEAIVHPGQSAILAVGRQHERVVARAISEIDVARGVNLTLSVDHRVIDGLLSAQFINTLAERVERGPWTVS